MQEGTTERVFASAQTFAGRLSHATFASCDPGGNQQLTLGSKAHMSHPTDRRLATAEAHARHLATDVDEQLRLLQLLRNELLLKRTVERGTSAVGHRRFEANPRTSDMLQRLVREDREVLDDLRATLVELRNDLRARGRVLERRAA